MTATKFKTTSISLECRPDILHDMKIYAIERETSLQKVAIEAWEEYLSKPQVRAFIGKPVHIVKTENEVMIKN